LKRTRTAGCSRRNCRPILVNDSVSDAAAETVSSPRRGGAALVGEAENAVDATSTQVAIARTRDSPVVDSLIVSVRLNEPSLLDQIVLALVAESPRHGFDVSECLAKDEALAMAVTVRRPLVYRALDDLAAAGLISVARREPGARGAQRVVFRVTPKGRRTNTKWLNSVVAHPRDARIELLAKFALRSRRGMPQRRFAAAQRRIFEPIASALSRSPTGESPTAALVRRWRRESVSAMVGLLADLEKNGAVGHRGSSRSPRSLSATE